MSIRLYDAAVVNKIKSWAKDDSLTITSPDETLRYFEYQADISDDKPIKLPLIAVRRARSVDIKNTNKNTLSFSGKKLHGHHFTDEDDKEQCNLSILNAIPIGIGYQIDIYTRYAAEADEYLRNFVYNIVNHPKLKVEIPYNDANYEHYCTMDLVQTAEDNSDIPERLSPGQFTRWSLGIRIEDAYLFSVPIKKPYHIDNPVVDITTSNINQTLN